MSYWPGADIVIKKIVVALLSCGFGLVAGTVVATPVIGVLNHLAADGPYFSAPLVALLFLALPIGLLLVLIQSTLVAYEVIARRALGNSLLLLGVVGGLSLGIIWYRVLASSQSNFWMLLAVCGIGLFQGFVVFGCHWVAYQLNFAVFEDKQ